jgi:hypothetical protein
VESPFPESRILETVRAELERQAQAAGVPFVDRPLRIATCATLRGGEQRVAGYCVTVLVDPKLGVPCDDPTAEPRWGAPTMLVVWLNAGGDRIVSREELPPH